jgi:hypothetical protein
VVHLQRNGFRTSVVDVTDLGPIKRKYNVPSDLMSCHTGVVNGYVVEGHVPADVVHKLLKEKPKVAGVAVAGMPAGSPGMEGGRPVPYSVMSFDAAGKTAVYAKK